MKLLRLEHLDIVCSDIKKSVEFYRKLGLTLEGTLNNASVVFMFSGDDNSPVRVELHQAEEGQKTGIDHVAFEVSDTDAAYKEGKYLGLDFKFEPLQNTQSGRRIANVLDPDGVQIQLARKMSPGEYGNWG
jgi:catechol 2,3-dioxygenase-like lactoylglutathione lyase family enzyme